MDNVFNKIMEYTAQFEQDLIQTRRYLHQHPELSSQEYNTANYIHKKLSESGINSELLSTKSGPAVIANLLIDRKFPTIAVRSDMDALPLCDAKQKDYCSKYHGVMHACGHDLNMAAAIGTIFVLNEMKEHLKTNIRLIFQPSEEQFSGGACDLIEKNVMHGISAVFSIHADPSIPAGKVGIGSGVMTSATDFFTINIKGRGGHSARPNEAADAVFTANNILNYLYSGINRNLNPVEPFVISIGEIHGGTAPNIISETCTIKGTTRTFSRDIRQQLHSFIPLKVSQLASVYGVSSVLDWEFGPPSVENDLRLSKLACKTARRILGEENAIKLTKPSMGSEDFSVYLQKSPGVLIRVGTAGENCNFPLHSCDFDIDETSISTAVKLLSGTCLVYK